MTIRRAILALGMVAALTFGAMALFGGQTKTANACCAGDPVLATENGMTLFVVGSPLAPVGGTINFRIAITAANVPYGGYTWDVLTSNYGVAAFGAAHFTPGSGINIPLAGLGGGPLCAAVGTNQLGAAPFIQLYGEGAGCASSVSALTTQLGDIATFSITCDEPGQVLVAEVDPAVPSASFPQTTLDGGGSNIPTELGPQLPNPLIPGAFIGGAGGLCVQAGDLGITKTASAPVNVIGGAGTYTLGATESASRTFSGAGTAYTSYTPTSFTDSGKAFIVNQLAGATVTAGPVDIGPPFGVCTWVATIVSNTATVAVTTPWVGSPGLCALVPAPPAAGIWYRTSAVPVGTIANISDTAPAGVTFSGVVPGCTVAAGSVTCVNKPLAPGANAIGTFTATYATCGLKVNTATISQPNPQIFIDVNPANNTAGNPGANVNVDCPNIAITKVNTGASTVFTDAVVTYNITVSNDAGGSAATNVVVSDVIGAGQTLLTATSGGSCLPINTFPCTIASIPSGGSVVIVVTVKMPSVATAAACDTASANQAAVGGNGPVSAPQVCVAVLSKFPNLNGFAKDTGVTPTIAGPLPVETLCDGIDGDGDGVVDDGCLDQNFSFSIGNIFLCKPLGGIPAGGLPPVGPFSGAGESACGTFKLAEVIQEPMDIDSCVDDDDLDGLGCKGNNAFGPAPWQAQTDGCLNVASDYIPGQTKVDCNGGEVGEGLGAAEFQVKFDDKLFQSPTFDCNFAPDGTPAVLGSTGRLVQPQVSIITENWVMFGCVTKDPAHPIPPNPPGTCAPASLLPSGFCQGPDISGGAAVLGTITLHVQPDLFSRMRPAKENGVSTNVLDENCEKADTLGQPFNEFVGSFGQNAAPSGGLSEMCKDAALTIRMLEGDINLDCQVNIIDDQGIAFHYGQFFGQLNYNRFFDLEPNISPDFDIDIKDVQTVFGRNGSTCANPIPNQPPLTTIPDP